VTDTNDELQVLIDTVDQYYRRWCMDINRKKREVMVMQSRRYCSLSSHKDHKEGPCGPPCSMTQHWSCRGTKLKVVDKYKYLGIWFT
jgi:hypothetical protein